jgi:hypothetical protein
MDAPEDAALAEIRAFRREHRRQTVVLFGTMWALFLAFVAEMAVGSGGSGDDRARDQTPHPTAV